MRILLVTSWDTPCGIAEHSALLMEAVRAADPTISFNPNARALAEPEYAYDLLRSGEWDLLHLNHHDALHSRWDPRVVEDLRRLLGIPTVVTYHDTRSGEPGAGNGEKLKAFARMAAGTVVHEPVADIPEAHVWRQGVPAAAQMPAVYRRILGYAGWQDGYGLLYQNSWKDSDQQPVLGTMGFNFPWKNYDRLAKETRERGWALVICCSNATPEDGDRWRQLNPSTLVVPGHLPTPVIVNYLAGCDATAFMYECQNNGTSGAVRMGLAARKPLLLFTGCRQFRDLAAVDPNGHALGWCNDWDDFGRLLEAVVPLPWDPQVTQLAEQDSWARMGVRYAKLYRNLVGR